MLHQRCSSKESTRCPKKSKSCPKDPSLDPKNASRAQNMQVRCPKKAARAQKMQVFVQRNAGAPWLIHGSVVANAQCVAQAKVVSECRCCDGHHIARRPPALADGVCTGADPEQGIEMTMNKRSRLDRKIGQNNNVLNLQVARDRARQSRDGANGHVSLSLSNSETTEVSHQRLLERLKAENGQLRGSVVELVLQIRALRGYLAGRLQSG
jgi:hypothetical protein